VIQNGSCKGTIYIRGKRCEIKPSQPKEVSSNPNSSHVSFHSNRKSEKLETYDATNDTFLSQPYLGPPPHGFYGQIPTGNINPYPQNAPFTEMNNEKHPPYTSPFFVDNSMVYQNYMASPPQPYFYRHPEMYVPHMPPEQFIYPPHNIGVTAGNNLSNAQSVHTDSSHLSAEKEIESEKNAF